MIFLLTNDRVQLAKKAQQQYFKISDIDNRKTVDEKFVVMIQSLAASKPQFFQCSADNINNMEFDVVYSQVSITCPAMNKKIEL